MNKRRLFIAINLPEGMRKKLAEYREKWFNLDPKKINWVRKDNLHITLVFIGYVDDDEMYEICNLMKEVAKKHEPFFISLERIILGPAYDKSSAGKPPTPRMFWVEGAKSQELADLQGDLTEKIEQRSGARYNAYRPHINLARFKYSLVKSLPEKLEEPFKAQIAVESIDLMQSNLKRSGAEYSLLESVELGE
jgi:2'-5' RNA ligase